MKKYKNYLKTTVLIYLSFAFIIWKINPAEWNENTRFIFVFFLFIGFILVYPINRIIEINKKN